MNFGNYLELNSNNTVVFGINQSKLFYCHFCYLVLNDIYEKTFYEITYLLFKKSIIF